MLNSKASSIAQEGDRYPDKIYAVSSRGISFHGLGDPLLTVLEWLLTSESKSQVRWAMPEQSYLLDSWVLVLPCPHHHAPVFCRCFPAGLSCCSSFMQYHIWPQKFLSVKPPLVPASVSSVLSSHFRQKTLLMHCSVKAFVMFALCGTWLVSIKSL